MAAKHNQKQTTKTSRRAPCASSRFRSLPGVRAGGIFGKDRIMAKQKAKIKETWEWSPIPFVTRRIWIVSKNGHSEVYYAKKDARAAKAELDAKAVKP